jgi:hypothetical protein
MALEFSKAMPRRTCEWSVWIGQPMLYDGALCVERDYLPDAVLRVAVSLDLNHRIIAQSHNQEK